MGRLDGKVGFLTGAGAGIAKATALAFAREGARVAIAEINVEAGRNAERDVRAAGGEAIFIETDVTQDASVKKAIDATVAKFGRLDVMMNCAGGSLQEDVPVHEMDLAIWQRTIALNLLHPFLCCRHGIPHMMKAGGGSIINLGSHLGLTGSEKPAYAAAKGGIMSARHRAHRALDQALGKQGLDARGETFACGACAHGQAEALSVLRRRARRYRGDRGVSRLRRIAHDHRRDPPRRWRALGLSQGLRV
jgi:NAD(P)-dependent dehydrogenase (short-subunit alcohol dehydrogenase family)